MTDTLIPEAGIDGASRAPLSSSQPSAEEVVLLTVTEAARRLRIGRSLMYELLQAGQVASIHVGRLHRIRPAALEVFVDRLEAEARRSTTGQDG